MSYFPKDLNILVMHFFLLFHVRVNIEVKGCCNIGMTEQYAYGLVVAQCSIHRKELFCMPK